MYYLQPQFPPPCGPFCPGCRLCCDIVFCDKISTPEKNFNDSSTKSLIDVLEDVKRRTEFLQQKLDSFEKNSTGTQVEKFPGLPSILEASNIDLVTTTSIDSESTTVQHDQKCNLLYDKLILPEGSKSSNDPIDPKEIMKLCLTMMKEIKEVKEKLQSPKRVCKNCHSGHLNSGEKLKSLINENDHQVSNSSTNCPKCKRILSCHRNPQYSYSRGTACYLKNRRNFYHPSVNEPRAYPRRRNPKPEEIQNTWCCWPFF